MGSLNIKTFNDKELLLIADLSITVTMLCKMLNTSYHTITRVRKSLGISNIRGRRKGACVKNKTIICNNLKCQKEFVVKPASKRLFCCKSCSTTVKNPATKGKGTRPHRVKHHTQDYKNYKRLVHALSNETYINNMDIINPNNYPRTLCGVDGGWQLDHIIPVLECYTKGISPKQAAELSNLRMLPWRENLMRHYKGE